MITGGGKGVWIQRNRDHVIRLFYSLPVSETWPIEQGIKPGDDAALLGAITAKYSDWSSEVMAKLTRVEGGFHRWPLYCLPPGHRWVTKPGMTILGDAAHVMPPFTGKGANMALIDALELTHQLVSDPGADVTAALTAFEEGMRVRMGLVVNACLERLELNYGIKSALRGSEPPPGAVLRYRSKIFFFDHNCGFQYYCASSFSQDLRVK